MTKYYWETENYEGDFEAGSDEQAKDKCKIVMPLENPLWALYKEEPDGKFIFLYYHKTGWL